MKCCRDHRELFISDWVVVAESEMFKNTKCLEMKICVKIIY